MTWGMLEKVFLRGTFTALTGLRVGGGYQGLSALGIDNVVVRHALLDEPYLPGSSIRGKMRCSLERLRGTVGVGHDETIVFGPADDKTDPLVQLFGTSAKDGPGIASRVFVRDALLTHESRNRLAKLRGILPMTETKTEVCIDRITSAATSRMIERVPAGAEFKFEIVLEVRGVPDVPKDKPHDKISELLDILRSARTEANHWGRDEDLKWLLVGLHLLQDDALGGHTSRGYGCVKITLSPLTIRTRDDYLQGRPEQPFEAPSDELAKLITALNDQGEPERARLASELVALEGAA